MSAFATIADLQARYPQELTLLAADEITGLRDDDRIIAALGDASADIRGILFARYTSTELASVDAESVAILKIYCMDIALYRVSLSFSRSNEAIKERHDATIKRLEAIAAGKGALTLTSSGNSTGAGTEPGSIGPNEVVMDAPERVFTRERLGKL